MYLGSYSWQPLWSIPEFEAYEQGYDMLVYVFNQADWDKLTLMQFAYMENYLEKCHEAKKRSRLKEE